jgi:hypothetical protein
VDIAFGAVMRLQRRMLTVSNHTRTNQRVGSLLWEISRPLMEPGSKNFILPISRYDIADYLGVGGVSQSLTRQTQPERATRVTARAMSQSPMSKR